MLRRWLGFVFSACALCVGQSALAEARQDDPLKILARISGAPATTSFSGVFVYQSGSFSETSRISHLVTSGLVQERLEVLDGSPREVVRQNDLVTCYMPEEKLVISDHKPHRKPFQALMPERLHDLAERYRLIQGGHVRVAGVETDFVTLEPRDNFRYGRQLWAERNSGLLVRARTLNEQGKIIEQFTFSQIVLGSDIDPAALRSKYAANASEWKHRGASAPESRSEPFKWHFANTVAGFQQTAEMRRHFRVSDKHASWQVVFSDGLAAVSIFIEAVDEQQRPEVGAFQHGAISIYKRQVPGYLITALGEVPQVTVQRFADGLELRK